MKRIYFGVIVLFVLSCAGYPRIEGLPERLPTNVKEEIDEGLEKKFQDIWEQDDNKLESVLNRTANLYYRSQKYSEDFDNELAQRIQNKARGQFIKPMVDSDSYRKLTAVKYLTYAHNDEVSYVYSRLLQEAYSASKSEETKNKAQRKMASFMSTLRKNWSDEPLAHLRMVDLFQMMKGIRSEATRGIGEREFSVQERSDAEFLDKNPQDYYEEFNKKRKALSQKAKQVATTKDELFEGIYENMTLMAPEREPQQQSSFYPSTGSAGNIVGNNFAQNLWALTYDDGPHASYTIPILQMLQNNNVKVTFFWLAQLVPSYPRIVQQAKNLGHDLANHSYSHADVSLRNTNRQRQIVESTQILTNAYGYSPRFFRCPGGGCIFSSGTAGSQEARQLIAQENMIHVLWNVDSNDWHSDTPDSIFNRTKNQINNLRGGVILFHDIHERSYHASKRVVEEVLVNKQTITLRQIAP